MKRTLPHLTTSALASTLQYVKDNDISDMPVSRRSWDKAKMKSLKDTPYGPMLVKLSLIATPPHANREMVAVNPFAYMHTAFHEQGGFFDMLKTKLTSRPSTPEAPWRLVLYSDEVVPGNQLSVHNSRKVWVIYFSFLELSPHLENENAWCPLIAEPSHSLKNISGGISQAFAKVIKMFFGSMNFDISAGVLSLTGPDGSRHRLAAKLSMLLQDGGAHKAVWHCKGESGTRLCMLCKNLVAVSSGLVDADAKNILICDVVFEHELAFASDKEVRGAIERLKRFRITETNPDYQLRSQAIGFSLHEHSLLCDMDVTGIVQPASQYCHDWMHGAFRCGVFNVVLFRFIDAVKQVAPTIWAVLHDYVAKWNWPCATKATASRLAEHFGPARAKSHMHAGVFKCQASDGLSLLPVLTYMTETVIRRIPGVNSNACDALVAVGDLVNSLQALKFGLTSAQQMRERVTTLLSAVVASGWREHLIPKFHWCIHFASTVERWGCSPTCWVHERKHKMVKRYSADIQNTRSYSMSVLSEVLSQQLVDVQHPEAFHVRGMVRASKATARLEAFIHAHTDFSGEAQCSRQARLFSLAVCSVHDIVLIQANDGLNYVAAELAMFVQVEGQEFALAHMFEFQSFDARLGSAVYRKIDNLTLIDLHAVLASVVFSSIPADLVRILIPFELQGFKAVAS